MIFRQYYLGCLSHASYLIGDATTGRAVVVDPQRDIAGYVADADALGLRIERIIETHFHADFLSGHLELAAATGGVISYGDAAHPGFAADLLHDGQCLSLGDVLIEVRATPGHTPESISLVVWEHLDDADPYGVLTGDTLFIGDVGRPDLLSSVGVSADELARLLYHSLHDRLLTLPDATRVFPAHGAGSSCGKALANETESTIGIQRRTNYALAPMCEDDFVAAVTEGQSVAPLYFSFSANRNKQDRPLLDESEAPPVLTLDEVLEAQRAGAVVLDSREPIEFQAGHLRRSVNIGLSGRFAEYAGEVIRAEQHIVLIASADTALEARIRLARIGFDRVVGVLSDIERALIERPDLAARSSRLTVDAFAEARALLPTLQIVDVRTQAETSQGTIDGAVLVPLAGMGGDLGPLDRGAPTVVYCASGVRSAIATSALESYGFTDVSDLIGGYEAARSSGHGRG